MNRAPIALVLAATVSGCGWSKTQASCSQGPGLSKAAYNGKELPERTVALTFDGGPSDDSRELADYLFAQNAAATFFVSGMAAAKHEDILAHYKNREHLVANGAFKDRDLKKSADPVQDIRRTDALISPYVSGNVFLLRFPRNSFDEQMIRDVNEAGLRKYVGPIGYDLGERIAAVPPSGGTVEGDQGINKDDFYPDTECWQRKISVTDCAQAYLREIRTLKQGIILFHDTTPQTLAMMKIVVPTLLEEQFSFVRVDAIPSIRLALEATGAAPETIGGPGGCNDYK